MKQDLKDKLDAQESEIKLLEAYSLFLEDSGYMDTDWRAEEPKAIDEFLKERHKYEDKPQKTSTG